MTLTPDSVNAPLSEPALKEQVVYFKAPPAYYGNLLTAYGGNLNFTILYTQGLFGKLKSEFSALTIFSCAM